MNFLQAFNHVFARNRDSLIGKALTAATGSGEALIREQLERVITNTAVRLSPVVSILDVKYKKGKFSDFNRLTALPSPGSAMGEGATTPERQASYARVSIEKKIMRRKPSVTDFLADTADDDFDAIGQEIQHHIYTKTLDLEFYVIYGNKDSNQFEHDGWMTTTSTNFQDFGSSGQVLTDLKILDDMIDETRRRQNAEHRLALLMTPQMNSKTGRLQTNIRLNVPTDKDQELKGIGSGFRLENYRQIPIIELNAMRPNDADPGNVIGAVTPSTSTSGGSIAADTYFFSVTPLGYDGEQLASAQASQVTSGSTSTITLDWTAVPNAIQYYIFATTTTGITNHKLVAIISAFTYDGSGTITGDNNQIVFTTNPTVARVEVPAHMQNNAPFVKTAGVVPEVVMLIDLDRFQGQGGYDYTNPSGAEIGGLISVEPLAKTDAKRPFLLTTHGCMIPAFEATCSVRRGLKVA